MTDNGEVNLSEAKNITKEFLEPLGWEDVLQNQVVAPEMARVVISWQNKSGDYEENLAYARENFLFQESLSGTKDVAKVKVLYTPEYFFISMYRDPNHPVAVSVPAGV
jgi:hypothetical protein